MSHLTEPDEILAFALDSPVFKRYPRGTFKTPVAQVLAGCMDLRESSTEPDADWNLMALSQINTPDSERLTVHNKCRQRGWSFNESCIAVGRGLMVPRSVTQFVSFNEKESTEKIEYARRCIDAMVEDVRPVCTKSNETELRFENGSRIESLPCKEPRGKGKPAIILDEYAMYGNMDLKIFQAAIGAGMRGGCVRVGSTPKPSGLFRDLATGTLPPSLIEFIKRHVPNFKIIRHEWPWWVFSDLALDVPPDAMGRKAVIETIESMTTQERVERYGTDKLKESYASYMIIGDLAGFQQECECEWVAEAAALIPGPLVDDARKHYTLGEIPPLGVIAIGADFAHRQDQTAFIVMHYHEGKYTIIDLVRMRGASSHEQAGQLKSLIAQYKPMRVCGDITDGFGHAVLIDEVAPTCGVVEGVSFSSRTKLDEMAGACVAVFNHHMIDIPASDLLLADDIKSITKSRLPAGGFKYDSPRTVKGHADSFWALALALYAMPRTGTSDFRYTPVATREVDWCKPEGGGEFVDFNSKHDDFDLPSSTRSGWGDF